MTGFPVSDTMLGLNRFQAFKFPGRSTSISTEWIDCFTKSVQVTSGRPCYKESLGFKINAKQSIAAFTSKVFPDPIEANIRRYPKWMETGTGISHTVAVGRDDAPSLQISFMRTVRINSARENYTPPMGLGTFPLFDMQSYKDKFTPDAATQGGVFLPMYGMYPDGATMMSLKSSRI